jgi:ABC-type transport system substrate-binding protein
MRARCRRTFLCLAVLLAACLAAPSTAAAADPNKVLRYAWRIAESSFDPAVASDLYSHTAIEAMFDPMLAYDYLARPLKLIPNTLRELPQIQEGGTLLTFRIRPDIYFVPDAAFKGKKRELIAQDYAYSLRRFFDPKLKSPWLFLFDGKIAGANAVMERARKTGAFDYDAPIEGLSVPDRYTLRLKLTSPDYNLLWILAASMTSAVAREVVEFYGADVGSHPVGTGPFQLKEWRRSSRIVLEANPDFRDTPYDASPAADDAEGQAILANSKGKKLPLVGRVEIDVIEEAQPRWLAFLNGEHDFIERVPNEFIHLAAPAGKLARNLAKLGIGLQQLAEPEVTWTYFNMEDPVVGGYTPEKIALRRAMSLGYNNEEERLVMRKGQAILAQTPIPPGVAGYDPKFRNPFAEYNPAKAKALLDLFGYVDRDGDGYRELPDGRALSIEYASTPDSQNRQFDELWKKSMDAIGIRITIKKARWPDLLKMSKLGKIQMRGFAWYADYPDADNFLQLLYGPNSGQSNDARFRLPQFDRLYDKAKLLPDSSERSEIYREMTRLMVVYAPWKLGMHRIETFMTQPWVIGFRKHPIMLFNPRYLDVDVEMQRKARN